LPWIFDCAVTENVADNKNIITKRSSHTVFVDCICKHGIIFKCAMADIIFFMAKSFRGVSAATFLKVISKIYIVRIHILSYNE
jgi:hypothetical protein